MKINKGSRGAIIDDEFDAKWESWVDEAAKWAPFFETVADMKSFEIPALLEQSDLATSTDVADAHSLKRSAEGKAVQTPRAFSADQQSVALLALGFGKGTKGELSVPCGKDGSNLRGRIQPSASFAVRERPPCSERTGLPFEKEHV
jgi:hypothetical protein